ncbi:MAG: zinc ribbon domain-containing protein [Anaerolineae bacterium]
MPMNCPNCGQQLRSGAAFCPRCGQSINSGPSGGQPQYQPPTQQPQQQPQPSPPYDPSYSSPGGGQPPAWYGAQHAQSSGHADPIQSLGSTGQTTNLWGPFAGYGTRRTHIAWLLEGMSGRAETLRDTVMKRFNQRQIPDATVTQVHLTGKGVDVERRPFYRIQRGTATVWLYIARFGEDLYISQASYIKGPISKARVILAVVLVGFAVLSILNIIAVSANLAAVADSASLFGPTQEPSGFLLSATCCTGPLGAISQLALLVGFAFSVYKFITEKDFFALMRAEPNEFQEDDIVSLEKAVNETVRQAADLIGIDRKLLAPDLAYLASSNRQRLI